jgi:tRNA pseudouridine32 synthase/23S rRNA pseudouridine746 synthase
MLAVLHEDAALVAVSKPAGIPVIPARGEPAGECLHRRLERQLRARLWVVHRIDRDASGVVAFARTAEAHRALSLAFERRRVGKAYQAFVAGALPDAGRLDVALHAARRGKMRPALPGEPGRREAVTEYAVERRWEKDGLAVALVEARPLSGRQHQIRVHLRAAGAPILVDPLYGRGGPAAFQAAPCRRLALHARRLVLPGPSGALAIEAPLAEDLARLRAWLDAEWRAVAGWTP